VLYTDNGECMLYSILHIPRLVSVILLNSLQIMLCIITSANEVVKHSVVPLSNTGSSRSCM